MLEATILVVDDEPNVVRLCHRLLDRAGFQVLDATSPSQALSILSHSPVDLLLADIRMPGQDGFELLTLARRHQPDLAVVIMTGYGTLDTAINALHQGADGLILKPFVGAELVQNVQRALQESQHKRDAVRLRAIQPLFDISEALFAETDPQRLRELIVDAICGHLRCNATGLYEFDPTSSRWRPASFRGELLLQNIGSINELLEEVKLAGMPLLVNHDRPGETHHRSYLDGYSWGSLICVPIFSDHGNSIFLAVRGEKEAVFREADLETLTILARQAAVALENARLYADLRSSVRQLENSQHAMLQAEKMAAAARLTASIAHEINNPLQSLHNCLYLAGRQDLQLEEREKYLGLAQSELVRLMAIVQRMLDFYRPIGRDRKRVNINDQIKKVLNLMEQQLQKNGIIIKMDLEPDLPLVMAVATQIQQVLINLIINSMEAMPGGGEITIRTASGPTSSADKNRKNGIKLAKSSVTIWLEDTGPGVLLSDRERIFEPFISTKENGTGLGLAVSYGIIIAHGGMLELVEGRGKGACFRITLPEEEAL